MATATQTPRRRRTKPVETKKEQNTQTDYTTPYLLDSEYSNAYWDAKKYMRYFFEPLDEFERLAANKIRDDLPEGYPEVNDGTLAAMLMEIPMEILGQMVTGTVKVDTVLDPETGDMVQAPAWLQEVANMVWEKKIIPNANTDATFYVKWVVALYRAIKYGGQPIYDFFTYFEGSEMFGVDFTLPYVKDVYFQANKVSDLASKHIFMDSYYDRISIRRIINKAEKLEAQGVEQPWIVENLKKVYDSATESEKDARNQNPQERDKGIRQSGIKFTTCFQRSHGAPFCTFYEGLDEDTEEGFLKLKVTHNKDPKGDFPVHYLFAFQDLENPLGVGKVERAGGNQNVTDFFTQADVRATQIGIDPPIGIKGNRANTDLASLVYAPRQFWFEGDADIDVKRTGNEVYSQLPNRFGLYKSQVLNLLAKTDASISSEAGNPGFSKTDAGVKFQATRSGISANFLRQMFNQTFNQVATHMLNTYFQNMRGTDVMKITKEEAERLTRAGLIDDDPNTEAPSVEEIELIWDNMRGVFQFEVDPESSKVKDNEEQITKLIEVLKLTKEGPELMQLMQQGGYDLKLGELYRSIFTRLGLQDIEKIVVPTSPQSGIQAGPGAGGGLLTPDQAAAALQQAQGGGQQPGAPAQAPVEQPQPAQPQAQPAVAPEAPAVSDSGLTPEAEQELRETVQQYGVDIRQALAIMQARRMNVPEESIIEYLETGQVSNDIPAEEGAVA